MQTAELATIVVWVSPLGRISSNQPPSETPGTKAQAPEKFQASNTKPPKTDVGANDAQAVFELGAWRFFGTWTLEFGVFCLGSQFLKN